MIFGLHVATAGDLLSVPKRTVEAGGALAQIFAGNPRGWRQTQYAEEKAAAFVAAVKEQGIDVYIHMLYLVNYASKNEEQRTRSIEAYREMLKTCEQLGCKGVVTHLGSHKGLSLDEGLTRVAGAISEALDGSSTSLAILENSAGAGEVVGDRLEELAAIYEQTGKHPRVKFCIDTAHTFAQGYDIRTQAGLGSFLDSFDQLIGLKNLEVMHLNDSKADLGSRRDRHENIGDGFIGNDGFRVIVNEPRLKNIPGILEVPGLDGSGPDKANLDRLKALVK